MQLEALSGTPNLYVSGAEWNRQNVLALLPLIDCNACGDCCRLPVTAVQEYEVERIAKFLNIRVEPLKRKWQKIEGGMWSLPSPCPFRNEEQKVCGIYLARPVVCKMFPLQKITRADGVELIGVTIGLCEAGRPVIDMLQGLQAKVFA